MGTTPFSGVILEELLKDDAYEIVMVVTQPDRPFGRKRKLKAPFVKEMALKHDLKVFQPERVNDHVDKLKECQADLIVTCAYGQIISQDILDLPRFGAVNVHASLLPQYRGGAPIHWAILNGEKESGVTLMEMDAGMDSGAMIAKEKVVISDEDTMGDLESKLMDASRPLIQEGLKAYLKGEIKAVPQEESEVSFAPIIRREHEKIDFHQDVEKVYNHIRAFIPWPVSYGLLEGERVKFHAARMKRENVSEKTGTVLKVHREGVDIACENGFVTITKIQPAGKPVTDPVDFMNGVGRNWKGKRFE